MEYAAIDFEKLNDSQLSVCEVGIVVFKDGKEVGSFQSYIKPVGIKPGDKPKRNKWAKDHLQHITDENLLNAPTYKDLFSQMHQIIRDKILVSHSKAADLNYIFNLEENLGLQKLYTKWADTMEIAQALGKKENLPDLYFELFGEPFTDHHKAEDDARACGQIFERLSSETDIRQFIHEEEYVPSGKKHECNATNSRHTKYGTHNVSPDGLVFNHDMITDGSYFMGKTVTLSGMPNPDKIKIKTILKERLGAKCSKDLKDHTNVLIIGKKVGPSKKEDAKNFQQTTGLLVITDDYFWELVQGL